MAKIKFNQKGFQKLRKEPKLQDLVNKLAHDVAAEASKAGGGDPLQVFDQGSPPPGGRSGYQVTELALEDPRGATSVMAVGAGHHHNRKHSSLLRGVSVVAAKNRG